ncbi:TauD/TfdA family dioxygenase [Archangium lansingense]|uniref:TauD/TfdA family dioxygenase n=1 Tax=Archangium lansingense TaxID=2995310 RepID=A0ABT4A482_9BACT|nr:TauD/TfdA family dioxygenase [Archangium lansinium]MCY1076421.1 TauD/TfdA family dioxygenase [Archangium lansinium]
MLHRPDAPIHSAAAWEGASLRNSTQWIHVLTPGEREELRRTLHRLRGLEREEITRGTHALPELRPTLSRLREEIHRGRGFVLVRGVPIEGHTVDEVAKLYWLLGLHFGAPVPQNGQGETLCHIRDTGADPKKPTTRLYTTRAEQDFHTDGADIIGLLCLKPARQGGVSQLVSSVRVFNELLRKRPDLMHLLFEDWYWHLHGSEPEGTPPFFQYPICRYDGVHLSTFFISWWIRRAQELPGVPPPTPEQVEVLKLYEETANDPALVLGMDFQPGDIQFLKNSVILHKRTEYQDWEEPERKRHLLRLWLSAQDFEDGDDFLRKGFEDDPRSVRAARERSEQ